MKKRVAITQFILVILLSSSLAIARTAVTIPNVAPNDNDAKVVEKLVRDYGWVEQASGFTEPSRGIHFMCAVDSNIVWASAYDGSGGNAIIQEFTKTTNGGELWTPGEVNDATGLEISMIFAIDANTAWVPMYRSSGNNPQGIYKTTDGGLAWIRQTSAIYDYALGAFPNIAHFWDENEGWCQGDPVDDYYEMYTTTDGGVTWNRVPERDIPAPLPGEFGIVGYYSVIGDIVWWGTNMGRVYKSTDRGHHWTVCNPVGSLTYVNIWFKDSINGILQDKGAGTTGLLYETSDGGLTWTLISHTGKVYYEDISYVPGTDNMYVSTGADYLTPGATGASYSLDGGHSWTIYAGTEGTQFLATDWIEVHTGWAGGFNLDQFTGGMWKYGWVEPPPPPLLPPENLTATALPDLTVQLEWSPPPSGLEGWIYWGSNIYDGSLGLIDPGQWDVASRFTVYDMMPYVGNQLTIVKFYPCEATADYTVRVWTGTGPSNLTVVAEIPVPTPLIEDWNEITLPTTVPIEEGEELWIGYHINQPIGSTYPAGMDAGPSEAGLWANTSGYWEDLSGTYNNNWLIQGYIETPDGKVIIFDNNNNKDRDLIGYNVYHSLISGEPYDSISSVPATDTTYIHTTPIEGIDNYYVVTAVYDEGESDYSNEACVFVENPNYEEYIYDDGTAESGYCAGAVLNCLAVRITPNDYPVRLRRLKYFITSIVSQLILRVWDDDGTDGLPGTQLLDPVLIVPTSELVENDWSVMTIPESYDIMIVDGDFYIGWMEPVSSSLIGVDENGPSFDRSYQYTGGMWFDYTIGIPQNIMMRAVVETFPPSVDDDISQSDCLLQNYPNPVKNSTFIHYNLKHNKNQKIEIQIFNILGQMVDKIEGINGKAVWYPEDLPNGIYFYKLVVEEKTFTKKMVLMR